MTTSEYLLNAAFVLLVLRQADLEIGPLLDALRDGDAARPSDESD
jgi:hypothetical protein